MLTFRQGGLEENTLCILVSSQYLRKGTNTSSKPVLGFLNSSGLVTFTKSEGM